MPPTSIYMYIIHTMYMYIYMPIHVIVPKIITFSIHIIKVLPIIRGECTYIHTYTCTYVAGHKKFNPT